MKALSAEPSKAGARCNGYPLPQESKAGKLTPPCRFILKKGLTRSCTYGTLVLPLREQVWREVCFRFRDSAGEYLSGSSQ